MSGGDSLRRPRGPGCRLHLIVPTGAAIEAQKGGGEQVDGMKSLNNTACGTEVIPAASADAGRLEMAIRSNARLTRMASARVEYLMETARTSSRLRQDMARPKSRLDGKFEALASRVETQSNPAPRPPPVPGPREGRARHTRPRPDSGPRRGTALRAGRATTPVEAAVAAVVEAEAAEAAVVEAEAAVAAAVVEAEAAVAAAVVEAEAAVAAAAVEAAAVLAVPQCRARPRRCVPSRATGRWNSSGARLRTTAARP